MRRKSQLVDIGTFVLITSSIHVRSGEPVGSIWKMFTTAFRALMEVQNGRATKKKREKYTCTLNSRDGVNSIPENFTLLTTTKWSNSDICVNKANPPGDCARPENSRVRERDYPHSIIDFIWLIKRLSRFPHSTSLSLAETVARHTLRERSTKNVIYIPLCREIEIFAN